MSENDANILGHCRSNIDAMMITDITGNVSINGISCLVDDDDFLCITFFVSEKIGKRLKRRGQHHVLDSGKRRSSSIHGR